MCIIFAGLVISLVTVILLLPPSVSFGDAVFLAGAAGRLNAVTTHFDWNDRFNIWSGLHRRHLPVPLLFRLRSIAGAALPHRQIHRAEPLEPAVQRRGQNPDAVLHPVHRGDGLRLLPVRAAALLFQQIELKRIAKLGRIPAASSEQYQRAFDHRKQAALALAEAHRAGDTPGVIRREGRVPRGAERTRRRARRRRQTGGEHGRRKGLQRHQLHLSHRSSPAICLPELSGW